MPGAWLSSTVTCWLHTAVFPWMSVAVQLTVVIPRGYCVNSLLVRVIWPEQLSLTVGLPKATFVALQIPGLALTKISAGHAIKGAALSVMVTNCTQTAVYPETSVAIQLTVVIPTG